MCAQVLDLRGIYNSSRTAAVTEWQRHYGHLYRLVESSDSSAPSPAYLKEFISSEDGLRLAKAFMQIPRSAVRLRIVGLVRDLAGEGGE